MSTASARISLFSKFAMTACLATVLGTAPLRAEEAGGKQKIKIVYANWGKFSGETLKDYGIVPDIVATTFREAGYDAEVSIIPFARAVKGTIDLEFDVTAGLWEGPSFDNDFLYLNNVSIDKIELFVFKDSPLTDKRKFENTKVVDVGCMRQAGYGDAFYKNPKYKCYPITEQTQAIDMMLKKRIDAVVCDTVIFKDIMDEKYKNLKDSYVSIAEINRMFLTPGISKKHPQAEEIVRKYNIAFLKLVKDGLFRKMYLKHGVMLTARLAKS